MKKNRNCFSKIERRMVFKYRDFVNSEWWTKQKDDWYSRHKKRCARCRSSEDIHLHHKKYPKDGRYLFLRDSDFIALCKKCHFSFHKKYGVNGNMNRMSKSFATQFSKDFALTKKYDAEIARQELFLKSI